jgi:hypothetical protein
MSDQQNPANEEEIFVIPADFQPMTLPKGRLSAPDRPGWHRHWFRGSPDRLEQARRAYYQFVKPEDVRLNNFDLGGDATQSGNTDLGTRVSVVAGDDLDNSGQPSRLYLMECRQELFAESQKLLADRNEQIATALRGGQMGAGSTETGETQYDVQQRYVKGKVPDLFNPHKQKLRAST